MGTLWQDIRYGFRMLARSPGYAIVTMLTLALGIGATTAIFSMVNGILLRPLTYPQSQQLVHVSGFSQRIADKFPSLPVGAGLAIEWQQRCSSFAGLSLIGRYPLTMTGRGEPEQLNGLEVSANLFGILRVQPAMGRLFTADDEEGESRIAIISDGLWRRKFSADPSILGEIIMLNDDAYTVVGVLSETFRFPNANPFGVAMLEISTRPAVFVPKVFTARERSNPMAGVFHVIGRLKDDVTCEQAAAELNVIMTQVVDATMLKYLDLQVIVKPLKEVLVQDSRCGLLLILGAIGTLLLIACLNLGILGLVRAECRGLESAVRAALGASRTQLLRQSLIETILIAIPGAALGVAVASAGVDILVRIMPGDIPRLSEVSIDENALFFALILTGIITMLSGVLPAWRTAGTEVERALKAGGRTATSDAVGFRLRNGLVTAEVSLGVMLLVTAGLLLGSFTRVMFADRGFQAPTVLAVDIPLPPAEEKRAISFYDRLLEHLASAPGVESVAIVSALPLEGEQWVNPVWLSDDTRPESERPLANVRVVSSGYFQTMGIPLLEGRTFDQKDRSRNVVVISQRLARALWPKQDTVVGQKVMEQGPEREIIGVVKDVRARADSDAVPMLYHPHWFANLRNITVVARAKGDPLSIVGSVRAAVHDTDADAPITNLRTMQEVLEESVSQRRFQALLTLTFASCALLLASLGIYGVVSYAVARRTREMGIRLAFGAQPSDIYQTVLRQGMTPVILGLLIGVAGACDLGHILQSLLYEISPTDPLTIFAVVAVMSFVAVTTCFIPARRATRIDPMEDLRYE